MKLKLKQMALTGALILTTLPVMAENIALVIGNRSYDDLPNVSDAVRLRERIPELEAAGFEVFSGQDMTQREQTRLATRFANALADADNIVVFLAGHMVTDGRDNWLLAIDADRLDMFSIGGAGLSIGAVLQAVGEKPGAAMVLLAEAGRELELGRGLHSGLGDLEIPQGVALVRGEVPDLLRFLDGPALQPGLPIAKALEQRGQGLRADGFISDRVPFLPALRPGEQTETAKDIDAADADRAYWEAVQAIGSIEALMTYVDRYPNGKYIRDANRKIGELRDNPKQLAAAEEKRLRLTRDQRKQIQRNLSLLGFNPRGIDGVFGRGSRAAIAAWQKSRGFDANGYMTGNQISALQAAADDRARELEEEARKRQEEQDRKDAAFWRQTGQDGTEDSLRTYLKRYPDGIYSEIAREKLDRFEAERRAAVAAEERQFWDDVRANDGVDAYRQYLDRYPRGAFAQDAKQRIDEIEGDSRQADLIRRAKAEEARIAGNGIARLLVEQQLRALGLKPGRVDGKFDDHTRKAIRKFQRARKIPVTGYVTQQTVVRLLATR